MKDPTLVRGTAVAQWLRCWATNWKVAGSIPDGVIGIFHWYNPPDRTMALGSTQPLTEMSIRRIPGGKWDRCLWLTTLPPPCAVVMKSWNLNFLEPSRPLQACNGTDLPFTFNTRITQEQRQHRALKVSKQYVPVYLWDTDWLEARHNIQKWRS